MLKEINNRHYNSWTILIVILCATLLSIILLKPTWVIGSDGFGYYGYVRSILFDGDLDFNNEFSFFDDSFNTSTIEDWKTPIGKSGNPFSVGPSVLWSPFIIIAEIIQNNFNLDDPYPLPGYSSSFQILLSLSTIFYTIVGLILIFISLKKVFKKSISWWSTILIVGVSPLPYYLIYEPSMSHGLTIFSSSLLFYLSIILIKEDNIRNKILIYTGLAIGLIFIIRWQDIIFAIIPAAIIIQKYLKIKNFTIATKQFIKHLPLILIPFLIIASIQLLTWKHLYGSCIAIPQGSSFFNLSNPSLWNFIFSGYHGMLIIHPLLILTIVGLFLAFKKYKLLSSVLLIALALQIYLNAGLYDWYGGGSFGARRMISSLPIFAFGLAFLLNSITKNRIKIFLISILFSIGIIFNGLLMIAYAKNIIPLNQPTTRTEIYSAPIEVLRQQF